MAAQTVYKKQVVGILLSLAFVLFVFSFSERHEKPLVEEKNRKTGILSSTKPLSKFMAAD
ncbi:hypothetical protein B4073_1215 [Bacillus subtilis]|nr:hypothetical protein B4069_1250 [Bacillus subtilis]PLV38023.1 hypothetical protein BSP2_20900 [Bacillus subtilis subsp. subtilis]KIN38254.1 hypothetical protein B4068_1224 [Bacillus subtilis]KIN42485.1 hypothetical protein B4071_1273 [Bacillus subtilis]KIN47710.1 hypothetical protein B4072_1419 [Bacillus subtilis]